MKRVIAITRKEIYHILRDPLSLLIAILLPLLMLTIFSYAIDMELRDLRIAVLDQDHSKLSREVIQTMTSSGFIVEVERLANHKQVDPGFRQGKFKAAVIIPNGFERDYSNRVASGIQVLVDGADGSTAATIDNYIKAVLQRVNQKILADAGIQSTPPADVRARFYFNPELESNVFIVPGLVAIIMIMICALLTSIAVVREKEMGSMEQILTTPVKPREVIIGKVIPYLVIACIDAALVLATGTLLFGVPMVGNWLVLTGYSLIYLMIALGLGLMISTVAKTQQVAMMLALVITLLPTLMLSGFVFAIPSMPKFLQWVSHIVPATYYLKVIRSVMLVGESWFPKEGGIMLGMMIFFLAAATKRFKDRLE